MADKKKKIAIVGGGGAGLGAAYVLGRAADVTVYEAKSTLGGHAHTVDVKGADGVVRPIDMGVLLTDPWTYPVLYAIIDKYKIETRAAGWTIGASFKDEKWWTGGPDTALWQRLREQCSRFEVDAARIDHLPVEEQLRSVEYWLNKLGYNEEFAAKALSPVLTLLVVTRAGLLAAPIVNILGLFSDKQLSFFNGTTWRLFPKGTRQYVDAMANDTPARWLLERPVQKVRRSGNSVLITDSIGEEQYDEVIFATQANLTLQLLADATTEEKAILGAFDFQKADVYLHSDTSVLSQHLPHELCSQYWYDGDDVKPDLQGVFSLNVGVGLGLPASAGPTIITGYNHDSTAKRPDPSKVFAYEQWKHELATLKQTGARSEFHSIQGNMNTWHCGTSTVWASADAVITSGMVVGTRPELGGTFPFTQSDALEDYQQIQSVMFPTQEKKSAKARQCPGYRRTR
ncbi:FAD-dependent oxidoreductase [Sandaracinus amylolyticus]|uniref:Amine oxidase, flavin-containing n=1 Tax=Sandaracinus amylolyticus TaxID=927083 RepID=A0A0F6YLQ8_9BACT|nr:FAD-dependent oxidoreductase [Sandaracinus amylolyticus]AKF10163.1 Amine oxidase, flavin-containing [Sandaracinus amylolyticus]